MPNEFYLQDSRSYVGDGLTFWARDGLGYVTDLDKTELFTKKQACNHRDTDIPWPKAYIDARAHYGVDHQVMDEHVSDALLVPRCRVYLHAPGDWNGNDVYWVGHSGCPTSDLGCAAEFTLEAAREVCRHANGRRKPWSADYIDSIRRRLVWRQDVDLKKALRGTGIKLAKPKPPRMMMFNCEGCGRFISDAQRYREGCRNCGTSNMP